MGSGYFRVDGADLETGEESYLILQAQSVADAEAVARKQGLLIAGVRTASSADWGVATPGIVTPKPPARVMERVITFEPIGGANLPSVPSPQNKPLTPVIQRPPAKRVESAPEPRTTPRQKTQEEVPTAEAKKELREPALESDDGAKFVLANVAPEPTPMPESIETPSLEIAPQAEVMQQEAVADPATAEAAVQPHERPEQIPDPVTNLPPQASEPEFVKPAAVLEPVAEIPSAVEVAPVDKVIEPAATKTPEPLAAEPHAVVINSSPTSASIDEPAKEMETKRPASPFANEARLIRPSDRTLPMIPRRSASRRTSVFAETVLSPEVATWLASRPPDDRINQTPAGEIAASAPPQTLAAFSLEQASVETPVAESKPAVAIETSAKSEPALPTPEVETAAVVQPPAEKTEPVGNGDIKIATIEADITAPVEPQSTPDMTISEPPVTSTLNDPVPTLGEIIPATTSEPEISTPEEVIGIPVVSSVIEAAEVPPAIVVTAALGVSESAAEISPVEPPAFPEVLTASQGVAVAEGSVVSRAMPEPIAIVAATVEASLAPENSPLPATAIDQPHVTPAVEPQPPAKAPVAEQIESAFKDDITLPEVEVGHEKPPESRSVFSDPGALTAELQTAETLAPVAAPVAIEVLQTFDDASKNHAPLPDPAIISPPNPPSSPAQPPEQTLHSSAPVARVKAESIPAENAWPASAMVANGAKPNGMPRPSGGAAAPASRRRSTFGLPAETVVAAVPKSPAQSSKLHSADDVIAADIETYFPAAPTGRSMEAWQSPAAATTRAAIVAVASPAKKAELSPVVRYLLHSLATIAVVLGIFLIILALSAKAPGAAAEIDQVKFQMHVVTQSLVGGMLILGGLLVFVIAVLLQVSRKLKGE